MAVRRRRLAAIGENESPAVVLSYCRPVAQASIRSGVTLARGGAGSRPCGPSRQRTSGRREGGGLLRDRRDGGRRLHRREPGGRPRLPRAVTSWSSTSCGARRPRAGCRAASATRWTRTSSSTRLEAGGLDSSRMRGDRASRRLHRYDGAGRGLPLPEQRAVLGATARDGRSPVACRFVYASSAAVYGHGPRFGEEPAHEAPLTGYGRSKWLFDQRVRAVLAGRVRPGRGPPLLQRLRARRGAQGSDGQHGVPSPRGVPRGTARPALRREPRLGGGRAASRLRPRRGRRWP